MPSRPENIEMISRRGSGCAGKRGGGNLSILTVVACATEGENDLKRDPCHSTLRYLFCPHPLLLFKSFAVRCLIFQSENKIRGREIFEPRKTIHLFSPRILLLLSRIVVFLGCQNVPLIEPKGLYTLSWQSGMASVTPSGHLSFPEPSLLPTRGQTLLP